ALVATLGGCQWLAGEPDPERQPIEGELDRRTDRGYRTVNRDLPRIGWDGQAWAPVGDHAGDALADWVDQPVILEGRMALDGSSAYRRSFRMVHQYDGCVFKDHRDHTADIVHVQLPEGQSVQVTDKSLEVEGVLKQVELPSGAVRLEFDGSAVAPSDPPPDRSARRQGHRPHS
ncbi:MAG: hypothetical protein ACI9OJ_006022, partial [Myxococcota bacterium]